MDIYVFFKRVSNGTANVAKKFHFLMVQAQMSLTVFCALIESCSVQMEMCFVHKEFQLELQVYFFHPIKMLCSSVSTVNCN